MNRQDIYKLTSEKQKYFYYNTIDFPLETFLILSLWNERPNKFRMSALPNIPNTRLFKYKKRSEWNQSQRSKFVESLILGLPCPPIVVTPSEKNNELEDTWEVIDGAERIDAINSIVASCLPFKGLEILHFLNGLDILDLPLQTQRKLMRTSIRTIVINFSQQIPESDREWLKADILKRFNLKL
jgi:hypothetical protein